MVRNAKEWCRSSITSFTNVSLQSTYRNLCTDGKKRQVRELQIATSQPLGFAAQYSVTALTALGLAFYTSWKLTLVTLATVPVSAIALSVIASQMQPSIEAQQVELTMASKLLNNALSAIDTVKCFNGQDFEIRQYARAIARAAKYYLKQARSNALQIGFVRIMTLGMFVQGFWYGSSLVGSGKTSAGDVLTTFWACLMATQAIEQILPQMIVLEKGRAAGAALKGVLEQMHKGRRVVKMRGKETPTFCEGDIEIRYVSLRGRGMFTIVVELTRLRFHLRTHHDRITSSLIK